MVKVMGGLCILIFIVWLIVEACKGSTQTNYLKNDAKSKGYSEYVDSNGNMRYTSNDKKVYK